MPSRKNKIWVSATELRNFMLNDPLLDWLNINYNNKKRIPSGTFKRITKKFIKVKKSINTFKEYILNQGNVFEDIVVNKIINKIGRKNVLKLEEQHMDARDVNSFRKTVEAIKSGIPVIHGAVLHNSSNNTYGVADLIIRSDFFAKIFLKDPISGDDDRYHHAPNLSDGITHYRIVDIKYSSLPLRADGIHLLNSGHIPCYKAQLWVYNEALALIQGYNPNKAYLLGRKWSYESCLGSFKGNSCFGRLGVIDYKGVDFSYTLKSVKAVEWMRDVKAPESKNWTIDKVPLSRPELYPNMSNRYDDPWRSVKQEIASNIDELTSIWMVGERNRTIAHSKGIMKWSDKRCDAKSMGINGEKVSTIIDKMLKVNRSKSTLIMPKKIKNNNQDWKRKSKIEFFVDFETVGNAIDNMSDVENVEDVNYIFMIGVGYIDIEGKWVYKDFTCKELSPSEELRNCTEFTKYVIEIAKSYKCKEPKCYHWSSAEPLMWDKFFDKYSDKEIKELFKLTQSKNYWKWVDLLEVFKIEPIIVRGAFSFSLKSIAKAMCNHGMISTVWEDDGECSDGKEAMLIAWNAYKKNDSLNTKEMKEVVKYNEVDTKVLYEILNYIRRMT